MAGISNIRRQKAWLKGVVAGASGAKQTPVTNPILLKIFERGMEFGQNHADAPAVKAMVQKAQPRRQQARSPQGRGLAARDPQRRSFSPRSSGPPRR